ncbi:MAG: hypothetical protein GOVbin1630_32 [Prokaryotic dsDNA virus sp.]|nr:MAG: hypothetical protein GOVbin1630_32 [Prokaryotic dsDNA virus sp.]|tara:strand:+ start:960 stop:1301 length:342 start_codon:yes stop_codon:yes gene_type:complete
MQFTHVPFEDHCKQFNVSVPTDPDELKRAQDRHILWEKQIQLQYAWENGTYGFVELLQESQLYRMPEWQIPVQHTFWKRVEYLVQQLVDAYATSFSSPFESEDDYPQDQEGND